MMLLEFSMVPFGKGESVSPFVARSLDIVDKSGLNYQLNAMGTIVEGEIDQFLNVLRDCFSAMQADCDRISCTAKFDYRKGAQGRIIAKVQSVESKLGRDLERT